MIHEQDDGRFAFYRDLRVVSIHDSYQEARMASLESAEVEYERKYREIRETAQRLIAQVDAIGKLRAANPEIAALAEAAEPGALVGDSTMRKETFETALLVLGNFGVWVATPMGEDKPSPFVAMYRKD